MRSPLLLGGSMRPSDPSRAGISTVSADLSTQTVLVEGAATVEALLGALTGSGMNARLVGQGSVTGAGPPAGHGCAPPPADRRIGAGFGEELARSLGLDLRTLRQSLAAVSEFKGDAWGHGDVIGVVRFVQVNRALCRVEAALDGLAPGEHVLAVHTFGEFMPVGRSLARVLTPCIVRAGDMTAGAASTGPVLR